MSKVFISYSRVDSEVAASLSSGLLAVGIQPWLDTIDVPPGYPIRRAIEDGIRTSDILVVLLSASSLESRWVEEELTTAAAYQLSNLGVKVLPVLLPGIKTPDLPIQLRGINYIQGADGSDEIVRGVLRVFDDQPTRVFLAPDKGKYNVDYYRYLMARIREATREVWITGSGFNCAETNPEGKAWADAMVAALEDRLTNNVKVVRVQTGSNIDPHWAREMVRLAASYPAMMQLWRLQEEAQHKLVSLSAIDPGSGSSSVAEIMLSDRRYDEPFGDYASVSTFIRRDPVTAQIICSRIKDLTQARGAYRVYASAGPDAFEHLVGHVYYFAYGSNMNVDQMKYRSGNLAEKVETGRLPDHELSFDQFSNRYVDGGVATITARPSVDVQGVVWRVPWGTIVALDLDEGPELYERRSLPVFGLSGRFYSCYVYVGRKKTEMPPSPSYLAKLIDASKHADLPRSHIEFLERLRRKETH
jgi:cation transport regulator ChaC